MAESSYWQPLRLIAGAIDPRRSLSAGAMCLIIALAGVFSCAAALWVGHIARNNVPGTARTKTGARNRSAQFRIGSDRERPSGAPCGLPGC